ncbi:MAG: oxidoreductase [Dehalococcoidia bacterium]|nr:MAG: oxidoreductase [Dehalococcoidia bacterium]
MPPTRIALLGLGGAAQQLHLPALLEVPNSMLVGAADPDPARLRWAVERGVALPRFLYEDAGRLLRETRPDVVIVGTPPETHAALCLKALDAGAHVFCEKPLAPTIAECDEIIDAADRAGRFVAVNNQYRHLSFYRATRAAIDRGEFGRPYLLQMWQQMPSPGEEFPAWKARLNHLILYEFGTHATDLIAYLLGGPLGPAGEEAYPTSLTTRIVGPLDRPDLVSVSRLDFPHEVTASMTLNWQSKAPQRYLEVRLDCEHASLRLSLGGVARLRLGWSTERRRPTVVWSVVRGGEARVERDGQSRLIAAERPAGWVTATALAIRRFIAAIEAGREPEGSARHARELLRTALACYQSAEQGGALVPLDRPTATGVS